MPVLQHPHRRGVSWRDTSLRRWKLLPFHGKSSQTDLKLNLQTRRNKFRLWSSSDAGNRWPMTTLLLLPEFKAEDSLQPAKGPAIDKYETSSSHCRSDVSSIKTFDPRSLRRSLPLVSIKSEGAVPEVQATLLRVPKSFTSLVSLRTNKKRYKIFFSQPHSRNSSGMEC